MIYIREQYRSGQNTTPKSAPARMWPLWLAYNSKGCSQGIFQLTEPANKVKAHSCAGCPSRQVHWCSPPGAGVSVARTRMALAGHGISTSELAGQLPIARALATLVHVGQAGYNKVAQEVLLAECFSSIPNSFTLRNRMN